MEKMKVMDLFSGIGGFSLAFDVEGFDIVTAIDMNPKACEIYRQNLTSVDVICEDICNMDLNLLPDIDVIIGNIFSQKSFCGRGKKEQTAK